MARQMQKAGGIVIALLERVFKNLTLTFIRVIWAMRAIVGLAHKDVRRPTIYKDVFYG